MSNAVLTNEQATLLLNELATNEGFRARYEQKPAAALVELGIPHETVVNLNASCLAPMRLADASAFSSALREFKDSSAQLCLSMITPQLRFNNGKTTT
jgi:putative modified peptide